jgi:hypothetical protein
MIIKIIDPIETKIVFSYEADNIDQHGCEWGSPFIRMTIPEGIDPECVKAILVDEVITLVEDTDKVAAKALAAKQARIEVVRAALDTFVSDGQFAVYGTRSEPSAIRTHLTYESMVNAPAKWVGNLFADEAAVLAYATPKLAASEAFALSVLEHIAQRDMAIAAILAE